MGLNLELVGRSYSPQLYEVGREKIRDFAAAIGDQNPAFHDVGAARALGHRDLLAPPTFPVVVTRGPQIELINDPELGLDFSRVVHGDQKFVYSKPVIAGDVLRTTAHIATARSLAGNDILTIRSEISDEAGDPVVDVFATLVARGEAAH